MFDTIENTIIKKQALATFAPSSLSYASQQLPVPFTGHLGNRARRSHDVARLPVSSSAALLSAAPADRPCIGASLLDRFTLRSYCAFELTKTL
jgi:hypothetical protein